MIGRNPESQAGLWERRGVGRGGCLRQRRQPRDPDDADTPRVPPPRSRTRAPGVRGESSFILILVLDFGVSP